MFISFVELKQIQSIYIFLKKNMNKIDKLFKSVKIYNIGTHLALNQIRFGLEWGGGVFVK